MMMKNILLYLLLGFSLLTVTEGMAQIPLSEISKEDIEKGKIRIKLKQEHLATANNANFNMPVNPNTKVLGITRIDNLGEDSRITRISRVFPFSVKHEAKHRKYGLHLWFEVEFDEDQDPLVLAARYQALSEVQLAKPVFKKVSIAADSKPVYWTKNAENDSIKVDTLRSTGARVANPLDTRYRNNTGILGAGSGFRTAATQNLNDPLLADQWHYNNDGTMGTEGSDIDLFNAWTIETGQPLDSDMGDIIVSIVDGGIDTDHEDLAENMWVNEAELNGVDGVDDDNNGYIDDIHGYNFVMGGVVTDHSHGTHVAGTVGAVSNNGIGVAGVAGGDGSGNGVKLMACQVFDSRRNDGENFAQAIVYGADNGAVISQNSWGYKSASGLEEEVVDAIHYFIEEAGQYEGSPMDGGILFFAAGNTGQDQRHYPAALSIEIDEVIAVAATGPGGEPAPYSTHGEWVTLSAPGGDQFNFGNEGGVLSTLPGDNYGYQNGTSMATPHVSGVAALVLAKFGGRNFKPADLKEIILGSVEPFEWESNDLYGVGALNAGNALSEDERIAPDSIDDLRAETIYHNAVALKWTVPKDEDNFQPSIFYLALSTEEITEDNFDEQQVFALSNPYEAGSDVEITINGLLKQKDYWFAVKSADRFLNTSIISNILKVTTTDAPKFAESVRKMNFDIDVEEDGFVHTKPVTLYNKGQGIITWNSLVSNETGFSLQLELDEWLEEEEEGQEEVASAPQLFAATEPLSSTSEMVKNFTVQLPDYYVDENTRAISGMSYVQPTGTLTLVGSGTPNAGLKFATRFDVPRGYSFNLTHINTALLLTEVDEPKPVMVEIRKGKVGTALEDTETIYVQEYYSSDTTVNMMYHNIPLYEPQYFSEETFYIVLHFHKDEPFPLVFQNFRYQGDYRGYFLRSGNKGVSYEDAYLYHSVGFPIVEAMSSGVDGGYVIVSPNSGEISAGDSTIVDVIVDATHLANGRHLASVGINTNDIYKQGVSIEVKTEVSGQKGEIQFEETVHQYKDIYLGRANELELPIMNAGLDTVLIKDVISDEQGFARNFLLGDENGDGEEDIEKWALTIRVNQRGVVPFTYTPPASMTPGVYFLKAKLLTSDGEEIPFQTRMVVEAAPTMEVTIDKQELTLAQDEVEAVTLTMTNTSESSVLKYDLSDYNALNTSDGLLTEKLSYKVSSSDLEPERIQPGQWDEIEEVGEEYLNIPGISLVRLNLFKMETGIPFYNQIMNAIFTQTTDGLVFSGSGVFNGDATPEEEEGEEEEGEEEEDEEEEEESEFASRNEQVAKGLLGFLVRTSGTRLSAGITALYHYSFGDREVFTMKYSTAAGGVREDLTPVEYSVQVALFRNGVIEYRYKGISPFIEQLESEPVDEYNGVFADYKVGIQGLEEDDYILYREPGDDKKKLHDGLVIRFEPEEESDISLLYDASEKTGSILPGKTEEVTILVKPSVFNAFPNHYKNQLRLETNAENHTFDLAIDVTEVAGTTNLDVLTDTLDFGVVVTNASKVLYAEVASEGINTVQNPISSVTFGGSNAFELGVSLDSIKGDAKVLLPIVFSPTQSENVEVEMIMNFVTGEADTVWLMANGVLDPIYSISEEISGITVDLDAGTDTTFVFTIDNEDRGVDLNYRFENGVFAKVDSLVVNNMASFDSSFTDVPFDYTWNYSEANKVFYKWDDISDKDSVEVYEIFHGRQKPVALPFKFPFYGEFYDTIWVSKNGYVSVNESEVDDWKLDMKAKDGMSGVIAPFYAAGLELNEHSGGVRYWENGDRVVVQWDAIGDNPTTEPGNPVFQVELVKDGSIYFHYKTIEEWGGTVSYGIESPDETEHLYDPAYIMRWSRLRDSTTVAINRPLRYYIETGKQTEFSFNISAKNIYKSGTYQDKVTLYTNTSETPVREIPVTLNVTGSPVLKTADSLTWENIIYNPLNKLKEEFVIYNKGVDTLEVTSLVVDGIDDLVFFDKESVELGISRSGNLDESIKMAPWESTTIKIEIPVQEVVEGSITVKGTDVEDGVIAVKAEVVDSPIFDWDGVDQTIEMNQSYGDTTFTFNIHSLGTTVLETSLIPFVATEADGSGEDEVEVQEIGNIAFDLSVPVVDSLTRDTKDEPTSLLLNNGTPISHAVGFTAPNGGMTITHVKAHTSAVAVGDYVRVAIHHGTELEEAQINYDDDDSNDPTYGERVFWQRFEIHETIDSEWIYLELERPQFIPEGQYFWVIVGMPRNIQGRMLSYEVNYDPEVYKHSQAGPISGADGIESRYWSTDQNHIWKIRPLTAAAGGQWISLDPTSSQLEKDSTQMVTATVYPELAKVGQVNKAIIRARTNDVNTPYQDFNVELTLNGAPELQHRPNAYQDTLQILETEELMTSYIFTDYEGEAMTITLEDDEDDHLDVEFEQINGNAAKLKIKTTYESSGLYKYPVEVSDTAGNITLDTVFVNVIENNRPPVLNEEYQLVNLYMEDSLKASTFSIEDLFTDPDGDEMSLLAGNYTPDVFDLLLGSYYIDLHPIKPGVGFMVVAADDGKEDGFVVYGVYVLVSEEKGASGSSLSSTEQLKLKVEKLMDSGEKVAVYPNPTVDGQTNIMFKLDNDANVSVDIYDMFGKAVSTGENKWMKSGFHADEALDISGLSKGLYFCRLKVNGEVISTVKLIRQ